MTLNLMTPLPLAQPATAGCSCCTPRTTATPQPAPHEAGLSSTTADTATFAVAGMTCGHCIAAVTEELSTLPGVSAVNVDLVAGGTSTVTITSDTPVSRAQVAAALDAAGDYRLATS